MHHAVAHCVEFVQRFQYALLRVHQIFKNHLQAHRVGGNIVVYSFPHRFLRFQEGTFEANLFYAAGSEFGFGVHVVEFILDGRAATVQYEYFHINVFIVVLFP